MTGEPVTDTLSTDMGVASLRILPGGLLCLWLLGEGGVLAGPPAGAELIMRANPGSIQALSAEDRLALALPDELGKRAKIPASQTSKKLHPLHGQPAPTFRLALLEGGEMDLAPHLSNQVIVLNFWATWHRPCAEILSALVKVTTEFREHGVVFWSVNVRERPPQIRSYLERKDIACPVALDPSGNVSDLYRVQRLPHLVVIDRDGRIGQVQAGAAFRWEPRLRAALLKAIAENPSGESARTVDAP